MPTLRDMILFILQTLMCIIVLISLWFVDGPWFWMAIILGGGPLGFALIDMILHEKKSD